MDAAVRIGELARRTGVSPELLRAWEQRYGLLRPQRSPGGFRLYSAQDEARVRRMTALLADGVAAAEAAREAAGINRASAPPAQQPPLLDDLRADLRIAMDGFDTAGAHAVLDRLFASMSLETAIGEVVIPYLNDLGERWRVGRASVGQEHFASHLLRGRLLGLAREWGSGQGPSVVLAGLPGEEHDLGLVMFGLLVARRGWKVTFLGANTPFSTLDESVRLLRPAVVVLSTVSHEVFDACAEQINAVAWRTKCVVAAPVDAHAAARAGARVVTDGIVDAARALTV